jgi:hypothetical protein
MLLSTALKNKREEDRKNRDGLKNVRYAIRIIRRKFPVVAGV